MKIVKKVENINIFFNLIMSIIEMKLMKLIHIKFIEHFTIIHYV
jgi:hypothetical protein